MEKNSTQKIIIKNLTKRTKNIIFRNWKFNKFNQKRKKIDFLGL
jgi:hypothetical protein